MDPRAIRKAKKKLLRAQQAVARLDNLRHGFQFDEIDTAWAAFLVAANGIYTHLEVARRKHRTWYLAKEQEKLGDPLLSYVYYARNHEEHALEDGTKQTGIVMRIPAKPHPSIQYTFKPDDPTEIDTWTVIGPLGGNEVIAELVRPGVHLLPVREKARRGRKAGVVHPVPTSHLGSQIAEQSPYEVARLALVYLQGLVSEAETLS